jgi:hypothetical protein
MHDLQPPGLEVGKVWCVSLNTPQQQPGAPTTAATGRPSCSSRGSALAVAKAPAEKPLTARRLATCGLPGASVHSACATSACSSASMTPKVMWAYF